MIAWIGILVTAFFIFWMVIIYNRLVSLKNEVGSAWSQIDVQLKRRHDLIPNLVSVVRGYMEFEKETLERVIQARSRALSAASFSDKAREENSLTSATSRFFAVAENYPILKSNENALQLMEELTTTENKIAFSRQFYNDLVANYRTRLEVFPDILIAFLFSFKSIDFFSAPDTDRTVPKSR